MYIYRIEHVTYSQVLNNRLIAIFRGELAKIFMKDLYLEQNVFDLELQDQ